MKEHIPAKIGRGLCRANGTGQCAPICLTHSSVHTRDGGCPEHTIVHRRQITEILYALDFGGSIDKRVEGGYLSGPEAHTRTVSVKGKYVTIAELESFRYPLEQLGITEDEWRFIVAKMRRLKGVC